MPAIMDDPSSPTIHRVSGPPPYPDPNKPELPETITPRQVTLRDRQTIATIVPFVSRDQVPASLLTYLSDQFAKEIEGGDTYPMIDPMPLDKFSAYWFQNFAGIMLLGQISSPDEVVEGKDWSRECLGSFYIKPNYPGRSSHICNAGFLVTDASRNRGVGRLMGESYLDWAPKLGYSYSVFNLVYETNVASCKIWDALGFKRIGRVKECGNLKSYPDRLVDAIIYGRDLGTGAEGGDPLLVSEERFDKIKFYLKYGRYPNGSDRAEKSRLRSAATHYKLTENDVLMLKEKEVISDPIRQMGICRKTHEAGDHAGINKTTATIAEKYHWSRIKDMVSDVIRTCDQCKDAGKTPSSTTTTFAAPPPISSVQNKRGSHNSNAPARRFNVNSNATLGARPTSPSRISPGLSSPRTDAEPDSISATDRVLAIQAAAAHAASQELHHPHFGEEPSPYANPTDISSLLNPPPLPPDPDHPALKGHHRLLHPGQDYHDSAAATLASLHSETELYQPVDPRMISQPINHSAHQPHPHHHHHHAFDAFDPHSADSPASLAGHDTVVYSPRNPHPALTGHDDFHDPTHQHHSPPPHQHEHHTAPPFATQTHPHSHDDHNHDHDHHRSSVHCRDAEEEGPESFEALLQVTDEIDAVSHHQHPGETTNIGTTSSPQQHHHHSPYTDDINHNQNHDHDQEAVDRDLDMLIDQDTSSSSSSDSEGEAMDIDIQAGDGGSDDGMLAAKTTTTMTTTVHGGHHDLHDGAAAAAAATAPAVGIMRDGADSIIGDDQEAQRRRRHRRKSTKAFDGDGDVKDSSMSGDGGAAGGKRSSIYDVVFDDANDDRDDAPPTG